MRAQKALEKAQQSVGSTINRLTIKSVYVDRGVRIACICACGKEVKALYWNVAYGTTKSCGCLAKEKQAATRKKRKAEAHNRAESLIGKVFGALTITGLSDKKTRFGHNYVKAICKCGKTDVDVMVSGLFNRRNGNCGCRIIGGTKGKKFVVDPKRASAKRVYDGTYRDGDISFDDFLLLSQEKCFYCGEEPKNSYNVHKMDGGAFVYNGLDRIDNTQSHNKNNVHPCCRICNVAKNKRTIEDFFAWIERIHARHTASK